MTRKTPIQAALEENIVGPDGRASPKFVQFLQALVNDRRIAAGPSQPHTIASGAITPDVRYSLITVDTEAAAATDDLLTINSGNVGDIIYLRAANAARTVTLKHQTGNISMATAGDFALTSFPFPAQYDGTYWRVKNPDAAPTVPVASTQAEQETGTATSSFVSPGRQQYHDSAAKCWLRATVSGGTPSIADSYNITSITDTDVGKLTVTIATDFSSVSWSPSVSIENTAPGVGVAVTTMVDSIAVGSVLLWSLDTNAAIRDPVSWSFQGFGDQ